MVVRSTPPSVYLPIGMQMLRICTAALGAALTYCKAMSSLYSCGHSCTTVLIDLEVQRVFGRGQGAVGAHVSKEDFMLNRMMKEQGAAPTWIFERKDINSAIIALIDDLHSIVLTI